MVGADWMFDQQQSLENTNCYKEIKEIKLLNICTQFSSIII